MKNSFNTILYLRTDICAQEIATGGSVTHTLGVIKGFKNLGIKIICASSALSSILQKTPLDYYLHLKVFPLFFFLRWKLGYLRWNLDCLLSTISFVIQVKKLFKIYEIDAIYQRYSIFNCTGILLSRFYKKPLILEYNGSEVWAFTRWGQKPLLSLMWLAKIIEKINIHHATYITVVSQVLHDDLVALGVESKKIIINPNGVDSEVFNPARLIAERETLRHTFNITDKFVIGFIGTFSYWHGIEMLSRCIPIIIEQNPQIHFLLIGDGPLKELISTELAHKKVTKEHVTFSGQIPFDKAADYLSMCDAFISPTQPNRDTTKFFGSPTKIFEYLSMGKPVVASNLEQLKEVVSPAINLQSTSMINNEVGILIDPCDDTDLIKSIIFLSRLDRTHQDMLGVNARTKAIHNYTWHHHVTKIINHVNQ
jgi:glycosyltransferase involved in cell wall biosynthesis